MKQVIGMASVVACGRRIVTVHQSTPRSFRSAPKRRANENRAREDPLATAATPFRLHVPDSAIDDLRERLARTRFPDQAPGAPWAYGADVTYLRELVAYWRDGFD